MSSFVSFQHYSLNSRLKLVILFAQVHNRAGFLTTSFCVLKTAALIVPFTSHDSDPNDLFMILKI